MSSVSQRLGCTRLWLAGAVVLLTSASVAADPVRITSGSVVYSGGSVNIPVTLSGDNFTFSATTDIVEGLFTPREQCSVEVCVPGSTVDLHSLWLGLAFHSATVTYNGETFRSVGSLSSTSSMLTEWNGTLAIPVGFTGGTLIAPVSLLGEFAFLGPDFTMTRVPLVASDAIGTASLTFTPWPFGDSGAFQLQSARFDIQAASATPEPASMILLGTGLVGLVGARRRQRRASLPQ